LQFSIGFVAHYHRNSAQKRYFRSDRLKKPTQPGTDHNFLHFLTIFGEKIGGFIKNQCCDQNFAQFSFVLSKKPPIFFADFFGENNLKIITSAPTHRRIHLG
jgi:hypothetical protein